MHAILGTSEHCIALHASDLCVALVALDASSILKDLKALAVFRSRTSISPPVIPLMSRLRSSTAS